MDKNQMLAGKIAAVFIVLVCVLLSGSLLLVGGLVAVAILYALFYVCKYGWDWWRMRPTEVAQQERFLLFLVSLMLLFLATGTAWYMLAFYAESGYKGESGQLLFHFTNVEYLFRALAGSFQLFTGSIDSNVLDTIHDKPVVKGLISVQAALSFTCTVAVLFSLVYARLEAYFKLHRKTRIDESHNHLYVFFGMNEPSRLLAKDIWKREGEQAVIVFVETTRMSDDDESGWSNIIGMFTHRRQTFTHVDKAHARVTFTETRLCDVEMDLSKPTDVLGAINLRKLKELIGKLSALKDRRLHIFLLSENEDENIRAMSVLAMDQTILAFKKDEQEKDVVRRLYCHARRNGINRVVEDIAVKRSLDVRIIDSSYLSIELLKSGEDGRDHPVQLVELDPKNPTTVRSEFNALVVGFDEAGQDAVRFLYEFGAFVDAKATPEHELRSPFHCVVTDKRMAELQGAFALSAPAALAQRNVGGSKLIELHQCDCNGSDFYDHILTTDFSSKVNYVVITVGDDDLGMMLAIRILNHIRRVREDLSRLRIYVRNYRSDKEAYMQKIANYYNEGYCRDCAEEAYKTKEIIIPFGQMEKLYTYDLIIYEELTEKGKRFQRSYSEIKGDNELWDDRRKVLTGAGRKETVNDVKVVVDVPEKERVVSLNDIRSLRRKERQDLCNALHADTKLNLLRRSLPEEFDWKKFFDSYFEVDNKPKRKGEYDKIDYTGITDANVKAAILNLARLEHLRWNASHEMLGYVKGGKDVHGCNERTREHNCLRPWQELDEEGKIVSRLERWPADYKLFDFIVVDNTLLMNKDKLIGS
ncbi:MAG: hypothetical protein IJ767_05730 [Bacteroidaceae bacterium]|nr:hypothetical protein [Bacteroidaceae bacterium]